MATPGMTAISTTQTATYDAIGLAEDYSNIITNISPEKTPFLSTLKAKDNATELTFNWLTDALAPPQANAHLEMEDYVTEKVSGLRRLTNTIQFFKNSGKVSDAMRKVKKYYQQQDEYSRQVTRAFKQHALDLEYAIVANAESRAEASGVPAKTGGIPFFMQEDVIAVTFDAAGKVTAADKHNLDNGDFVIFHDDGSGTLPPEIAPDMRYYIRKDVTNPDYDFYLYDSLDDAVNDAPTPINYISPLTAGAGDMLLNNIVDADNRLFTEADINYAMELAYYRGGNPSMAYMSGVNKRRFSEIISSNTQKNRDHKEKKAVNVTDTYESDFGTITAHSHLFYSDKVIDLLDPSYWAHRWFNKPHQVSGLAKKGSYAEFVLESEYGFEGTQPLASARVKNIKRARN